jgi:hypothetical protein
MISEKGNAPPNLRRRVSEKGNLYSVNNRNLKENENTI